MDDLLFCNFALVNRIIGVILLVLVWITAGTTQVTAQDALADTLRVETESVANPFDVNHIPIRKNQANNTSQNLSFSDQIERHFSLIVIIGLLTLLSIIVLRQRDLFNAILRSLIREYALTDLWRNEQKGLSVNLLASYFFGLSSVALFLTLAIEIPSGDTYWQTYGMILMCLLGYFALKHLVLNILRRVYSIASQVEFYNSQIVSVNIVIGGVLFLLSIFMSFGPDIVLSILRIIGFIIISLGIVFQIGRTVFHVLLGMIRHPFPYFVYLCALEISPLMIIWSFFSS